MTPRVTITPHDVFTLTPEQQAFLDDGVRPFTRKLAEIARKNREGSNPNVFSPEAFWEAFEAFKAHDMLIYGAPEEYGGFPVSDRMQALITKEICRADAGIGLSVGATDALFIRPILAEGTPEQKLRWVPRFTAGDLIACYCQTEPGAGSDVAAKRVQAKDLGNGRFSISGEFTFITNGSEANAGLVMVITNPDAESPGDRFTIFIVDFDQAKADGTLSIGRNFEKLGLHNSPTTILSFTEAIVTSEDILGELHGGWSVAMNLLTASRAIILAMQAVGIMDEAIDLVDEYVERREVFGLTLAQLKNIKRECLVMRTRTGMIEALGLYSSAFKDAVTAADISDSRAYELEASAAKLLAGEWVRDVVRQAFQIFGGTGYMMESRIAHLIGDSLIVGVYEGTTQVQSMLVIKGLLGIILENMGAMAKVKVAAGGSILDDKLIAKLLEEWPFWKLAGDGIAEWEQTGVGSKLLAARAEFLHLLATAAADADFGAMSLRSEPRNQAPIWFRIAEAYSVHLAATLLSLDPQADLEGVSMSAALAEVEIAFSAVTAELNLMQDNVYRAYLLEEPSKS